MHSDNGIEEEISRARIGIEDLKRERREAELEAARAQLKTVWNETAQEFQTNSEPADLANAPLTGQPLTISGADQCTVAGCRGMIFAMIMTILVVLLLCSSMYLTWESNNNRNTANTTEARR